MLDEVEFRELVTKMGFFSKEEEITGLLFQVDPYKHRMITFSDLVRFLSATQAPVAGEEKAVSIMEKFI